VQILARSVAGKLAARDGAHEAGLALVEEAVELIGGTDDPSGQGDALLDLAEVRFVTGDRDAALAAVAEARRRYGRKVNLAGVRRADRFAVDLSSGRDPLG
jgi:hypothetical protein